LVNLDFFGHQDEGSEDYSKPDQAPDEIFPQETAFGFFRF
jgi:hypothetical protein